MPSYISHTSQSDVRRPGQWKSTVGITLMVLSISLWMWFFLKLFVNKPIPDTFTREGRLERQRFEIAIRKDPVQGIASKWDYEKDQWKS